MAKKIPGVDISDFNWSRGAFREPDMSKMPNLKPMASHEPGGLARMSSAPKARINRPLTRKVSR